VGLGVGVGAGVAVGVGAGVGLSTAVTSNLADARVVPGLMVTDDFEPGVALGVESAADVWSPNVVFGTLNDARKVPRPLVVAAGMLVLAPSQVSCTPSFGENPCPVTVTFEPGTPLAGDNVRVGPEALVPANGTA
jgi:hypothetical protein